MITTSKKNVAVEMSGVAQTAPVGLPMLIPNRYFKTIWAKI